MQFADEREAGMIVVDSALTPHSTPRNGVGMHCTHRAGVCSHDGRERGPPCGVEAGAHSRLLHAAAV